MSGYLNIAWTAQALSAEQIFVLRNIAVLYLKGDRRKKTVNFSHEMVEGQLTCKSEGLFVTFVGTFFHADLGHYRGERWTVDFLIPKGAEHLEINPNDVVMTGTYSPDGSVSVGPLNQRFTRVSAVSLLDD